MSENLKNMLLVLSNGGYLAPPEENPEREELWNETWKRINRFQPNLLPEIFPNEAGKPVRPRASRDERVSRDERRESDLVSRPKVDGQEQEESEEVVEKRESDADTETDNGQEKEG